MYVVVAADAAAAAADGAGALAARLAGLLLLSSLQVSNGQSQLFCQARSLCEEE